MTSTSIANEPTDMPISQYITNIRDKYNSNLDLSFMEFFMSMYDTNELVSAELLAKYGVLSIKSNRNSLDGNDIKKLFTRCHLIENVDYSIRRQLAANSRGAPKNNYILSPKAFKICLISSENENRYRDYFLFLEECIHYYNKGQLSTLRLENDTIKVENSVIITERNSLSDRLDQLMARMDIQTAQLTVQNQQLTVQTEQLTVQNQQMSVMQGTLDKIVKKLDDRAVPPSDSELTERFVLMKKNSIFYVIRSQERGLQKAIKKQERLGFSKVDDLLESELIPNSMYLWNCIKEELVKERKISTRYNKVVLISISESDLLDIIKQVFKSRNDLN
jgi:hypothetical protein